MNSRLLLLIVLLSISVAAQDPAPATTEPPPRPYNPLPQSFKDEATLLLAHPKVLKAFEHVDTHKEDILKEWIKLTEINAPSRLEQQRAKEVEKILKKLKVDVRYDSAGNLIATRKGTTGGKPVILDAHLDTVFQPGLKIKTEQKDGKLYAPGVGDNTRNIEGMLAILRALNNANIKTKADLIFLFTVEEESSLGGAKAFIRDNKDNIGHYIALDGGYSSFTYGGIGINTYEHHFIGPGGHTRSQSPPYSATLPAARAIARIYQEVQVPRTPPSWLNIGMLGGSEVVNAKAADAWFSVDLRSTDQPTIDRLEKQIAAIVKEEADREKMTLRTDIRSTLAASQIPGHRESRIVRTAEAITLEMGFQNPQITATASNNANVALLNGLSAISTGVGPCADSHALTENCEIEPVYKGIKRVLAIAVALAGME
jgi:tripeptide aminopeptidase